MKKALVCFLAAAINATSNDQAQSPTCEQDIQQMFSKDKLKVDAKKAFMEFSEHYCPDKLKINVPSK